MTIRDELAEQYHEALFADGLEDAILGAAHLLDRDGQRDVIAYDYEACILVFMRDGMSREDAEEWMSFNVLGAYMGRGTPVFVNVSAKASYVRLLTRAQDVYAAALAALESPCPRCGGTGYIGDSDPADAAKGYVVPCPLCGVAGVDMGSP